MCRTIQTYFEENPRDKQILRHDAARGTVKLQQHLKNVPDYISKLHGFQWQNKIFDTVQLS